MCDFIFAQILQGDVIALELDRDRSIKGSYATVEKKLFLLYQLAIGGADLNRSRVSFASRIIVALRILDGQIYRRPGDYFQTSPVDAGADVARLRIPFGDLALWEIDFD